MPDLPPLPPEPTPADAAVAGLACALDDYASLRGEDAAGLGL